MKVGILGSAAVARALGTGFADHGHEVVLGTRDPGALADWAAAHPGAGVDSVPAAAAHGELLVLAVKGQAAAQVLHAAGASNLADKPVIDTTNPIADAPADNGVISYFTDLDRSLMEQLQAEFPRARLVKAFNSVGNEHMVHPRLAGGPPTMFICGNHDDAKRLVGEILVQFGWEVADMGGAEAARAIEPLCILWCIPAFREGRSDHAFKLLRGHGGTHP
jgi:8-hydroxy-5-deazaflavin:NADPH oxidoreductase